MDHLRHYEMYPQETHMVQASEKWFNKLQFL